MKKYLIKLVGFSVACALCVCSLAACGANGESNAETDTEQTQNVEDGATSGKTE